MCRFIGLGAQQEQPDKEKTIAAYQTRSREEGYACENEVEECEARRANRSGKTNVHRNKAAKGASERLLAELEPPAALRRRGRVADRTDRIDHDRLVIIFFVFELFALDFGSGFAVGRAPLERALLVDLTASKETALDMRTEVPDVCGKEGVKTRALRRGRESAHSRR